MKTSPEMLALLRQWEGFRNRAYRCPSGILTIGYGHTGADVTEGRTITRSEAELLLAADVEAVEKQLEAMSRATGITLDGCRWDALVSIAFNIGTGALRRSMLWRKVCRDAADPSIPAEFRRWVHSHGKVMPGLVTRREKEAAIYAGEGYA